MPVDWPEAPLLVELLHAPQPVQELFPFMQELVLLFAAALISTESPLELLLEVLWLFELVWVAVELEETLVERPNCTEVTAEIDIYTLLL